jgi:cation/acetate symporter
MSGTVVRTLATTWVQIVKACLLLAGATLLAILVLARFEMNPLALFAAAAERYGDGVLAPGKLVSSPLEAISLGLALMFGTAGLPHVLMRYYTVPLARDARTSVFYATGLIAYFYLMTFVLGFGAMVLVGTDAILAADAGGNMAAPLLARLLGGDPFLGFISAVAFATILAVVSGLTLSGAAALSHDLWVNVVRRGQPQSNEELRVAKIATVALGVVAIALGVAFKGQNVAFMVALAFAIAASANFPALVLAIFWPRLSTAGAVASMVTGTVATLAGIWFSATIQIDVLGRDTAWFPLKNPALVTIPLAFAVGLVVSLLTPEAEGAERYRQLARQMHLGPEKAE